MKQFGSRPDPDHRDAERIALPPDPPVDSVPTERSPRQATPLHVCPACGSHLVHPTDWEESGRTHWLVSLRCPNCEWRGWGRYDQEAIERFDEELDRGSEALSSDLRRLVRANNEEEVERFVAALRADHVLPEDF